MQTNKPRTFLAEINVTPFVDVMLVLLIIFMVSAPMMKEGMKVDLPEAEARALGETQDLVITVGPEGTIDINGSKVELERLGMILGQVKEQRNVDAVYLQADRSIPYGFVVKVMSVVRSAGLTRIGLVTQPPVGQR
ncbi:MAG TPA: ExbD/TolR family protein [Deltaproteobacteria bacterium]|nr:ExbD/TolR family protein [Deltaproteobacteria bacterium]HOM28913.1 ExbD/TolR family protein [Deltaproteobacteria bacterium]HPP80156.1 ExbD/TolR family protein [Deltaproteobacteria bacterium]